MDRKENLPENSGMMENENQGAGRPIDPEKVDPETEKNDPVAGDGSEENDPEKQQPATGDERSPEPENLASGSSEDLQAGERLKEEAKEEKKEEEKKEEKVEEETEEEKVEEEETEEEKVEEEETEEEKVEEEETVEEKVEEEEEEKEPISVTPSPESSTITSSSETEQKDLPVDQEKQEEVMADEDKQPPENKTEEELSEETSPQDEVEGDTASADVNNDISVEDVDYSSFSPEALVNRLELLLTERPVQEVKGKVDRIKVNFYKKIRREYEEKRKRFLDDGGDPVDFKPETHPLEEKLKHLLGKYRDLKANYNRDLEVEKKKNLEAKYAVIEEIKNLVNRKESINKTFQEFRDLQEEWRNIGIVPQQYVKDLWENYHHNVERFYDYIKINKELRDLDLKKNLEKKLVLCERAEGLLLEPDIIQAFRQLQKLHEKWREIGPVPRENREDIWERFKAATTTINKKHQEHFQKLKETQRKNLEEKTALTEKAEEISQVEIDGHKDWEKWTKEILELQKLWKTIGFAPRKQNNAIYERFREACDVFFNRKRDFYAENKEVQLNNLQLKTDLCIQAEALQESTEWAKTTDELIALQKKWKEIGPVPRKNADAIWKRFRAACDNFFNRKSEFHKQKEQNYVENLQQKKGLIEEIEQFEPTEDADHNFTALKEFQRRWSDIGFVPYEVKTEIETAYRQVLNRLYNNLNIDQHQKNILKYRTKLESLSGQPRSKVKLEKDREKFINRIHQLESDITVWENNIGFFAHSDKVDAVLRDVQTKIDNAKASIELLKDKIRLIDEMD